MDPKESELDSKEKFKARVHCTKHELNSESRNRFDFQVNLEIEANPTGRRDQERISAILVACPSLSHLRQSAV